MPFVASDSSKSSFVTLTFFSMVSTIVPYLQERESSSHSCRCATACSVPQPSRYHHPSWLAISDNTHHQVQTAFSEGVSTYWLYLSSYNSNFQCYIHIRPLAVYIVGIGDFFASAFKNMAFAAYLAIMQASPFVQNVIQTLFSC